MHTPMHPDLLRTATQVHEEEADSTGGGLATASSVPVRDSDGEEAACIAFLRHRALQPRLDRSHRVRVRVGSVTVADSGPMPGELLEHLRPRAVVAVREERIEG